MQVAPINKAVERFAGAINKQIIATGMITGKNPFLKSFITSCFLLSKSAQVHEQRKLGQIGCLKSQVDNRQSDPAASFIQFHSKK